MSARYIIGDVFDTLATLEPNSVDLVFSSPPFLALRSYLPADDPLKAKEIGSEGAPADFLDTLLDVVEACDRVLAPHGSLCFELGDTYAGSGGAGGDYNPGGLHEGQPKFRQASVTPDLRSSQNGDKISDTGGGGEVIISGGNGWPLPKSLSGIPTLFAWSLAYGRNLLRPERQTPRWRIRNVVVWARPNPPVGALGDKFRPATSYLTVACKSDKRWFDLDAVRNADYSPNTVWTKYDKRDYPTQERGPHYPDKRARGESRVPTGSGMNPAGAPPLDYWEIPTQPYAGSHYATFPDKLVVKPVKAMCPPSVCPRCGPPMRYNQTDDSEDVRAMRGAGNESTGDAVLYPPVRSDVDSGGTSRQGPRSEREAEEPAIRLCGDPLAGAPHVEQGGGDLRAPSRDGGAPGTAADGERNRPPQERGAERQPRGEPGSDGAESPSQASGPAAEGPPLPSLRGAVGDNRACPTCGGGLRAGVVLDPFAGSGTTLSVATGHGRDAIGIDIDESNATLALERVGPLFLEVIDGRTGDPITG